MPLYRYWPRAAGPGASKLTTSTALASLMAQTGYAVRALHEQAGEYRTRPEEVVNDYRVVAFMSQSEPVHCTERGPNYRRIAPPPVDVDGNLTLIQRNRAGLTADTSSTVTAITDLNKNEVNPSMTILANALAYIAPGVKFGLVEMGEAGTGRTEMMNDATTSRIWERSFGMLTGPGECVDVFGKMPDRMAEFWWAQEWSYQNNWLKTFAPLYYRQRENGDAFPLQTLNPDGTGVAGSKTVDHCIYDFNSPSITDKGQGEITRDTPLDVLWHDTWWGERARHQLGVKNFIADSRFQSLGGSFGPPASFWTSHDTKHPKGDEWEGIGEAALLFFLPPLLRAAGFTINTPKLGNFTVAPGGAYAELSLVGGNGGVLSTKRLVHGLAPPPEVSTHARWQEVFGFRILRAGDPFNKMYFICRPGIDPAIDQKYIGTVGLVGGKIRITMAQPLQPGDMIFPQRPGDLPRPEYDTVPFQYLRERLDYPIEHIPGWYDPDAAWGFSGFELDTWIGPWKVADQAPAAYFTTVGNGPVFRDSSNVPANTTKIRHKVVMRIPDSADFSGKTSQLFDQEAQGFDVRVSFGDDTLFLQSIRDSAQASCMPTSGSTMGIIPRNVWNTMEFYVDFNEGSTGTFACRVNGTAWTKNPLSQKGTGAFQSNRPIRLHGVPTTLIYTLGAGVQIAEHEVWLTTGGVETSRMRVAGNAATVNASPYKDPASGNAV